ncbi:MAG: acetyl-CoA carboxylase biotin carboxyl carrier protein [Bdellovibrionales bacterium]|nr:acetyl-CoA carboxylase biotin carboxyl carrier protein [Oligoflexia bacterium]
MSKKLKTKPAAKAKPTVEKKRIPVLPFDLDSLGDLADFLKSKGIAEFEWSKGDQKIVVKTGIVHGAILSNAVYNAAPSSSPAATAATIAAEAAKEPASYKKVLSPFVGTFYRAPSQTAPSYAEVGKRVKPGDPPCIVEAMKLMNEIEADFAGKVVEVLVQNGQPVEFGEPLFIIDTA